ncbi:MAG: redoxin domain-containing protein [Chloroflexi bacterium]|nr:redoxin domain-containing protein [Chloroflexota bacterium]
MADLRSLADVIAVGADTVTSIKQMQATTKASFPLLRDPSLAVAKQYDMQLRGDWPMGMMGSFPEMGYVIVDEKGIIRAQRVDLNFGDHAGDIMTLLKK